MPPGPTGEPLPPPTRCAHCGEPIDDRRETFLLLDLDELPHRTRLDVVKRCCLPRFRQEHGRTWTLFSLASPHARRIAESIQRRAVTAPTIDQSNH